MEEKKGARKKSATSEILTAGVDVPNGSLYILNALREPAMLLENSSAMARTVRGVTNVRLRSANRS